MINYYDYYIKPKEIIKDINYFYSQIKDLICNEFFGQYLYNKRKKLKINTYTIKDYLSTENKTRLKFENDTIIVNFKVSKSEIGNTAISNIFYKNHKICGLIININVVINPQEEISRIIYPENDALRELRKNINLINDFYVQNIRKEEELKYKIIFKRILKIEKSYYNDWNKLIDFIKECVNPYFNEDLNSFEEIIEGINSNTLNIIYKMMHQTQFFQKYAHNRQIKYHKFIKSFRKECLDDNEIMELTNKLSLCFGHINENVDDCLIFIENVINHFNLVCHAKEKTINSYVSDIWNKSIVFPQSIQNIISIE